MMLRCTKISAIFDHSKPLNLVFRCAERPPTQPKFRWVGGNRKSEPWSWLVIIKILAIKAEIIMQPALKIRYFGTEADKQAPKLKLKAKKVAVEISAWIGGEENHSANCG